MRLCKTDVASDIQTIAIDIRKPGHLDLLVKAYHDIYLPAFPIADERDELDFWIEKLDDKVQTPSDSYSIILAGDNLDDPERAFIRGMSVGIYYDEAQSGLISYIAMRKDMPTKGLARKLVENESSTFFRNEASSKLHSLKAIFLEVHDPKCPNANDVMDPKKRVDVFRSWGALEVGEGMGYSVNYVQPPLAQDKGKCDDLMLIALPVAGKYPTAGITADFIRAMYASSGVIPPEKDDDFRRMMRELRQSHPALEAA